MAKIKQLKDKSGTEQIFPKTKTQAIYNTDGTLLSETLDDLYGSLATIESSPTTTSHSVGEYILYEGQVYKVTSVIASGDSLVVGTNISAVNLGDQISTLNGQVSTLNSNLVKVALTRSSNASRGEGFLIHDPAKKSVRIYATFYNATAIANNAVLFTVPSGYRPPSNVNVLCFYQSTSGVSAYVTTVAANGNVINNLGSTTLSGLIVGEYLLQ